MNRKSTQLFVASIIALLLIPIGAIDPAGASPFHAVSFAIDGTYSSGYTGINATRFDETIYTQTTSNCTTIYSGYPAYQTQWLTDGTANQVEIGTAHQCSGSSNFEYWFADDVHGGVFQNLWTHGITGGSQHSFWIQGATGSPTGYEFGIDATPETSYATTTTYPYARAGLESYDGSTTIPHFADTSLRYDHSYSGSWSAWTSTSKYISDPAMCGTINSNTQYTSGENTTC